MMRKGGLIFWVAVFAVGFSLMNSTLSSEAGNEAKEGVFIHIKSGPDEGHSVLMALQMAKIMCESKDVLVYVDVDGVSVLAKDGPDLKMEPFGSSRAAIGELISKGVTVMACPGCMKAKGVDKEDLMEGVQVAQKDAFFEFTSGRILSLTY